MSELINKNDNRATIRWKLLTGASALALTVYVSSGGVSNAEDAGQPQIWIELAGQLGRLQDGQETFAPPLMNVRPSIFSPSQEFEKPPIYGIDEQAKISFRPEDSNWIFSASIHYGRSTSSRHVVQATYPKSSYTFPSPFGGIAHPTVYAERFADTRSRNTENHAILDFQAGKDVGLGLFGHNAESSINLGVRFAQFRSSTNIALKSDPDWKFSTITLFSKYTLHVQNYHSNAAEFKAERSFRGVGPSLSWNASTPFAGNPSDGELSIDWGINAALLFGRQKTRTHHQTTGRYHYWKYYHNGGSFTPDQIRHVTYQGPATPDHTRTRNVTVPNVGGFAGLSYKYADAKISFGYRADFFFGAIDGGIDARKDENRSFYGPYASISIGLGD